MKKNENLGFIFMGTGMLTLIIMLWAVPIPRSVPLVPVKTVAVHAPVTVLSRLTPSAIAKELLTKNAYQCWAEIVKAESHFNPKARSPISDATGIGQLLKSTYASLGMKVTKDGTAQLVAMLSYINRHFSPSGKGAICNAWAYHKQFGTY